MGQEEKDAMGQAIFDYYNKNKVHRLRVDSSLTEDEEIDLAYLFRDFESMPEIEQEALKNCKGTILDVGAGSGSHSVWLQKNNYKVKAIDVSEKSVSVLTDRGLKDVSCDDFFELKDERFDTLLFLMNGVGIAGNLPGLDKFLIQCKRLLNPGGQVLLDSSDIVYMFDEEGEYSMEHGEYYGEMQYQMTYGSIQSDPFDWLYIGYDLLKLYAAKHSFKCELIVQGKHYDYLARLSQ